MCALSATSPAAASMRTSPARCPTGLTARIEKKSVQHARPSSSMLAKLGGIPERDMFNTFNMGVGMCCRRAANGGRRGRARRCARRARTPTSSAKSSPASEGVELCMSVRTAVLVSGGGTNLQALIDAQARGRDAACGRSVWSLSPTARTPTRLSARQQSRHPLGGRASGAKAEAAARPLRRRMLDVLRAHDADMLILAGLYVHPELQSVRAARIPTAFSTSTRR